MPGLLDLNLPDSMGLDTFFTTHTIAQRLQYWFSRAWMTRKREYKRSMPGQDYLVKGRVDGDLLVKAIRYAVERKMIEEPSLPKKNA